MTNPEATKAIRRATDLIRDEETDPISPALDTIHQLAPCAPERIVLLRRLIEEATWSLGYEITGYRRLDGASWADVADLLGVTRQAAQQRWGTWGPAGEPDDLT